MVKIINFALANHSFHLLSLCYNMVEELEPRESVCHMVKEVKQTAIMSQSLKYNRNEFGCDFITASCSDMEY